MAISYEKLCVDKEVYAMVLKDCVEEFLMNNPEFRKMKISHNKIVYEMARYYLNLRKE